MVESINEAIDEGDYPRAQALLGKLQQTSPSDPLRIRLSLEQAIEKVRIQRAHDAARLAQLSRTSAYCDRRKEPVSTFRIDG